MGFVAALLILLFQCDHAHADVKISALPLGTASATNTNDSFPYVDSATVVTSRLKLSDIVNIPTLAAKFPLTTKGDVLVFNGTSYARLPAGANGFVLSADSTQATGLKYIASGGLSSALTDGFLFIGNASNVATGVAMSGDATIINTGAITIANSAVTNAKMANMAAHSYKGNNTAGSSAPLDLTATQLTAELNALVGDSGAGGTKGLVPAPASGDAAANKFLKADGTWAVAAGASGITSLNALTGATQTFATGTSGSDFGISSVTSTHTFNLPTASASNRGALSTTDWSTFNGKESALTFSAPLSRSVNTISIPASTNSVDGYLTSADHTTFAAKQAALSFGNLTDVGTDGITIGSGTGAVIGSGTTISQHVSDTTHAGYLSSTDWNTFNGKQSTALTTNNILVGAAGVATDVAMSGDISIVASGATTYAGTVPLNKGGTGQTTKAAAFDALSPMTTGGDLIYGGASGTGTRLANGTAGQLLQSNGTTLAPTWVAAPSTSPLTTKGDVYTYSTVNARLPVGTDGQVLTADSAQTTGIKWATPSAASGSYTTGNFTGTTITLTADGFRRFRYTGSSAQVFTGVSGSPTDAQVITIVGTSNTNTIEIDNNDTAGGFVLNGNWIGGLYDTITFQYDTTLNRYIEMSRSN